MADLEGEQRDAQHRWGDSVRYLGRQAGHRLSARVPDWSAPRFTEPKHAPAATTAILSANRRLMRGTLRDTEVRTMNERPDGRRQGLTRPTYS